MAKTSDPTERGRDVFGFVAAPPVVNDQLEGLRGLAAREVVGGASSPSEGDIQLSALPQDARARDLASVPESAVGPWRAAWEPSFEPSGARTPDDE